MLDFFNLYMSLYNSSITVHILYAQDQTETQVFSLMQELSSFPKYLVTHFILYLNL